MEFIQCKVGSGVGSGSWSASKWSESETLLVFNRNWLKTFLIPQGHVGPHGGRQYTVPGGSPQVVHGLSFWPWDKPFLLSFLIEIEWTHL